MTAIDRYGFEMTVTTPEGVGPARLAFERRSRKLRRRAARWCALMRAAEANQRG